MPSHWPKKRRELGGSRWARAVSWTAPCEALVRRGTSWANRIWIGRSPGVVPVDLLHDHQVTERNGRADGS